MKNAISIFHTVWRARPDGNVMIDLLPYERRMCRLPDAKLRNEIQAIASVKRLAALPGIKTVLPGATGRFNYGEKTLRRLTVAPED